MASICDLQMSDFDWGLTVYKISELLGNACWPGDSRNSTAPKTQNGYELFNPKGSTVHCARFDNSVWARFPYYYKFYIGTNDISSFVYDAPKSIKQIGMITTAYSYAVDLNLLEKYVRLGLRKAGYNKFLTG
jgi:hypothetical protein